LGSSPPAGLQIAIDQGQISNTVRLIHSMWHCASDEGNTGA